MTALSPHVARFVAVIPHYGSRTIRRAAHDANLATNHAQQVARTLMRAGLLERLTEAHLSSGHAVVGLTEAGRDLQVNLTTGPNHAPDNPTALAGPSPPRFAPRQRRRRPVLCLTNQSPTKE